jgi:hypothetical protein
MAGRYSGYYSEVGNNWIRLGITRFIREEFPCWTSLLVIKLCGFEAITSD